MRHSHGLARPLTRRQSEVLDQLLAGATNEEIAATLGIGTETVKTYVSQVLVALDARNRLELSAKALAHANAVVATLMARIPSPFAVTDESGRILRMNGACEALGLRDSKIPVPHPMRARLRSLGDPASLLHYSVDTRDCDGGALRWTVERVWIEGGRVSLLWRIARG